MKKDIIYPIFLRIASQMDDTFWKYIYEDLSYNKCPYGIYIQNDFICCFKKGKEFSYRIDENNENILNELHFLLKNKAGILSEKEKIQQKEEFFQSKNEEKRKTINKKHIRDNLLQKFILEQSKIYDIKLEHCRKIINYLYSAFMFKNISIDNIDFENGYISNIDGIEFSKKKVSIVKNMLCDITDLNENIIYFSEDDKKKNLSYFWTIYLHDMKETILS